MWSSVVPALRRVLRQSFVCPKLLRVPVWLSLSAALAVTHAAPVAVQAGKNAPAIWRLDFLHTGGNREPEQISEPRLQLEPQIWTAPRIDTLERGDYRVELFARADRRRLFSASYSSVFADWSRSVEARSARRSFQESVRFPAPDAPAQLVLSRRLRDQPGQPFVAFWQMDIEAQALPDEGDKSAAMRSQTAGAGAQSQTVARTLHEAGAASEKLDLLFIAEGFTASEQEKFFAAAQAASEALFSVDPYRSRRSDINVRALFAASANAGIGTSANGQPADTALRVSGHALGMARYALTLEDRRLRELAMSLPYDNIVILTNSAEYSASGIYGAYTVVPAFHPRMSFLLVHELGHHLAGLADEYFHDTPGYSSEPPHVEPYEPNITALIELEKLKWRALLTPNTPLPTPWRIADYLRTVADTRALLQDEAHAHAVGAFRGANYDGQHHYRPSLNCLMLRDGSDTHFCPVCHQAIDATITMHAGEHDLPVASP